MSSSWGMARRVAELSVFGAAGQLAVEKRASMRLFSRPGFHHCSQKLALSAESSFSSCIFASSLFTASNKSVGFPRPIEIPWHKGLVNSVSLIGHINQSVDLKYLDTGKAVANTYIRVSRIAPLKGTDYSLFKLQFWDELAEIAAAHLKTEDHVCVTGSVWVESYMDQQSLSQTICKVVARDLKFVGYPSRTEIDGNAEIGKGDKERTATEDLWKNYFANPMDFWDNRFSKKTSNGPDFKHKSTGAALWIDGKSTPSWVHEKIGEAPKLTIAERAKETEKLWQMFFADPLEWWDNRQRKQKPTFPDFKNKVSGEALWIHSLHTPSWVKSQLELLDSKTMEGGAKSDWASASKERNSKTTLEDEDLLFF